MAGIKLQTWCGRIKYIRTLFLFPLVLRVNAENSVNYILNECCSYFLQEQG